MKRIVLFIMVVLCGLAFAISSASAERIEQTRDYSQYNIGVIRDARLPESLTIIEDEAFEGTAITNIILPQNVETIGDYAFANIKTLRSINVPNTTTYISGNAFKGSTNVSITGAPKGYARAWAHENGIQFSPITSFCAFTNIVQVNGGVTNSRAERLDVDCKQAEDEKHKPTDRMAGELNAEKKEAITAFHIQGRSPPMA